MTYSDDSKKEVKDYFKKRRAYVGTDGKLANSAATDTVEFVVFNLTSD